MVLNLWLLKFLLILNLITFMYLLTILYPLTNKNQIFTENGNSAEQFIDGVKKLNNRLVSRKSSFHNEELTNPGNDINENIDSRELVQVKRESVKMKFESALSNNHSRYIGATKEHVGKTRIQTRVTQNEGKSILLLLEDYQKHTGRFHNTGLCAGLFKNNSKILFESTKLNTSIIENQTTFERFLSMTRECSLYKTVRRFRHISLSIEEGNFPIAMSILIHNNLEQFERLLKSLYHPQNVYCVHVDQKASSLFKEAVKAIVNCFNNVFLASQPVNVVYASFSRLQADWNCLSDLRKRKEMWRYHVNLAGSEFPLVSNIELVKILKVMNGSNDIRERYSQRIISRFSHKYFVANGSIHKSKERLSPPPYNLTIIKGLAYNTMSREFVEYVFSNKVVQKLLDWSKQTYSPDEHFWSSVNDLYHNTILKSPGGYRGHPDTKTYFSRYINWNLSKDHCYGKYIRNVCVFTYGDLWYLRQKSHLIANKFDIRTDSLAFSCMEELLQNRTEHPRKINPYTYRTGK